MKTSNRYSPTLLIGVLVTFMFFVSCEKPFSEKHLIQYWKAIWKISLQEDLPNDTIYFDSPWDEGSFTYFAPGGTYMECEGINSDTTYGHWKLQGSILTLTSDDGSINLEVLHLDESILKAKFCAIPVGCSIIEFHAKQ
jgi:hypothetical protein